MHIKNIISSILDDDSSIISDTNLLSFIKHFANEFLIDLCIRNGTMNCLDLKDVTTTMDKDIVIVNIPENIKKYLKKRMDKKEIIIKFKLD
jgi:hypothetical protein